MKLSAKQLRRIIKEEVSLVTEVRASKISLNQLRQQDPEAAAAWEDNQAQLDAEGIPPIDPDEPMFYEDEDWDGTTWHHDEDGVVGLYNKNDGCWEW